MKPLHVVLSGIVCALMMAGPAWSIQDVSSKKDSESSKNLPAKVSIDAKETKVSDVFDSLAKQSKEKIILETSVKGVITASVKDSSLETALGAICKSGKLDWRKVYVAADSNLIEQPDRFAATLRLMSGLSFPDVVIAGSSKNKTSISVTDPKAMKTAEDSLVKELGMVKVYLISNDAGAAAKALDKEKKDAASKVVDDYIDSQKQQMDTFMKMTPEEREQALMASLNLMDQVGPSYMSDMMKTMMNTNPDLLKQMAARQTQMLFDMSQEDRRAMMKMNMKMGSMITPEQQKMLQEDAQAIMAEMKSESTD